MPSIYKRKAGSRNYQTGYSKEHFELAVKDVKNGSSILKASKKYKIPYGTLWNHSSKTSENKHVKCQPGRKTVLSAEEENVLVELINHLTQWKFPIDGFNAKQLVQSYLNKKGVSEPRFKDNWPGKDWLSSFIKRNNLTKRISDNVKPSRAEITRETVNEFFKNLDETYGEGELSPSCIFNYDETNVTDEPNSKSVIVQRGLRRVERKVDHSKSSVSIMFAGSADGKFLPPFVVYKAQNVYEGWTKNGPDGTGYDCSKSGWFDQRTFERWFFEIFLPYAQSLDGKKILIGDNLSSHFSIEVVQACDEYDIAFVSLLPNATHLLQPLDVAVFGPAKRIWRSVLEDWRKESRKKGAIPKEIFPQLLRRLFNSMEERGDNLVSGFRATGLYPLDPTQVLKRLPPTDDNVPGSSLRESFGESVVELLREHVGASNVTSVKRKRGPKVAPGKRVSLADLQKPQSSKRPASRQSFSSSSEESSDEEDDVCQICYRVNPPGCGDKIKWEGCDNCDLWYHTKCLNSESATSYCSCL